jgi:hypothetical protein
MLSPNKYFVSLESPFSSRRENLTNTLSSSTWSRIISVKLLLERSLTTQAYFDYTCQNLWRKGLVFLLRRNNLTWVSWKNKEKRQYHKYHLSHGEAKCENHVT